MSNENVCVKEEEKWSWSYIKYHTIPHTNREHRGTSFFIINDLRHTHSESDWWTLSSFELSSCNCVQINEYYNRIIYFINKSSSCQMIVNNNLCVASRGRDSHCSFEGRKNVVFSLCFATHKICHAMTRNC